jgi:hypothetical protein
MARALWMASLYAPGARYANIKWGEAPSQNDMETLEET